MPTETYLLDYDLTPNSLVLDMGGYYGMYTKDIFNKFNCKIYTYEPVSIFYNEIKNLENDKIKIFNFGLGASTRKDRVFIKEDSTGIHLVTDAYEYITIRDIVEVMDTFNIEFVDLARVNIEGCEYELLERLIDSEYIKKFKSIAIQFHRVIPNEVERRNSIIEGLQKTHKATFSFPFCWEGFTLCV